MDLVEKMLVVNWIKRNILIYKKYKIIILMALYDIFEWIIAWWYSDRFGILFTKIFYIDNNFK